MSQQGRDVFIGRENELKNIGDLISEWGTHRVLCIHGEGGVGKTYVLQEVYKRWRGGTQRLAVTEVMTFEDHSLHIAENLRHRLSEMLDPGPESFEPYLHKLLDYRKMVSAGLSAARLRYEHQAILQEYHTCLREVFNGRRGVVLLDTIDALEEGGSGWKYLVDGLLIQPCNAVFIVAGRNARALYENLRSQIGEKAQPLELSPLAKSASEQYLRFRQNQLHYTLDPTLREKLILLARGRPILMDLAVDWLSREHPLPWLEEMSLEEIQELSTPSLEERRREFEHRLVRPILNLRTDLDRLLLALAHVYPLSVPLASQLLGKRETKVDALFEEVRSYISIKELPGGQIRLHDKVLELLAEVEEEVHPEGQRRRSHNRQAASYFQTRVSELREKIQEQETAEDAARSAGQMQEEFDAGIKRIELEREYWGTAGQLLHHELRGMPEEGVETFIELFEEATRAYNFSVREGLIERILRVYDRLSASLQYEIDIRRAQHLLDQVKYRVARDVLLALLENDDLLPYQQVKALILLGNTEIRLESLDRGIDHFKQAVDISQRHGMKKQLMKAELALGWGKRLVGQLREALEHYRESYILSVERGDQDNEAWSLNNMAFANARLGHWEKASPLCEQAEALWEKIGNERGLGALYEVYGEVYTRAGDYDKALSYFNQALRIFEAHRDVEWLCRIYTEQGITYRFAGDLDEAERVSKQALELEIPRFKAQILHGLAHIYEYRGDTAQANKFFVESYQASVASGDASHIINNLGDMARLSVERGRYDQLEFFKDRYREYKEKWPNVDFYRAEGSLLIELGKLALGAHPDDVEHVADYFVRGLPLMAEYANLHAYTVQTQLRELDAYFETQNVPPSTVAYLGERLYQTWQEEGLDIAHPEALSCIIRWKNQ